MEGLAKNNDSMDDSNKMGGGYQRPSLINCNSSVCSEDDVFASEYAGSSNKSDGVPEGDHEEMGNLANNRKE